MTRPILFSGFQGNHLGSPKLTRYKTGVITPNFGQCPTIYQLRRLQEPPQTSAPAWVAQLPGFHLESPEAERSERWLEAGSSTPAFLVAWVENQGDPQKTKSTKQKIKRTRMLFLKGRRRGGGEPKKEKKNNPKEGEKEGGGGVQVPLPFLLESPSEPWKNGSPQNSALFLGVHGDR